MNRYLIWYWQQLRLEKCNSLSDILDILAQKPLIEIAGPRVSSTENRTFYLLEEGWFNQPEFCILQGNRVHRYGSAPGARVQEILVGFRERNGSKIKFALKSIFDQLAP
jgi:hypothetical protein